MGLATLGNAMNEYGMSIGRRSWDTKRTARPLGKHPT
jgi:hypothetical protein